MNGRDDDGGGAVDGVQIGEKPRHRDAVARGKIGQIRPHTRTGEGNSEGHVRRPDAWQHIADEPPRPFGVLPAIEGAYEQDVWRILPVQLAARRLERW